MTDVPLVDKLLAGGNLDLVGQAADLLELLFIAVGEQRNRRQMLEVLVTCHGRTLLPRTWRRPEVKAQPASNWPGSPKPGS